MRFASAFSGIEAASSAWHPLGWETAVVIEFDAFPSAVLAHHYPDTPNLGDITQVTEDQIKALGHLDVFVFGSPCQDLSVAGKRKGLEGERSGLFFDAMRLVRWMRQHCGLRWAVWENVPGAFSSNKGADFAAVVAALGGFDVVDVPPKGWGTEGAAAGPEALVEWSTLDAQWFGVAQRRRRCFAVADFGAWAGRPPVLLEPDRLRGDSAPSREAGQIATAGTLRSTDGGSDVDHARGNQLVRVTVMAHGQGGAEVRDDGGAPCLTCNHEAPIAAIPATAHTLRGEGFDASEGGTGRGTPLVPAFLHLNKGRPAGRQSAHTEMVTIEYGAVPTLTTDGHQQSAVAYPVPFDTTQITSAANYSNPKAVDPCHPLAAGMHAPAIAFPGRMSATQCASSEELSPSLCAINPTAVAFTGEEHASPQETDAIEALRALRQEVGEEAFAVWRSGILDSFQPSQVLRQGVHGQGVRCEAVEARCGLDDGALPREASDTTGAVQDLWKAGRERRAPQGRGLSEQLDRQLDSALSKLSHEGSQPGWLLHGLRGEGERAGLLQPALHPAQGRSDLQVRRLTPEECEKLQGFLPGHTQIPWRKKPADQCPDGPRYKALGNSMAVPVMRWIGQRIEFAHLYF